MIELFNLIIDFFKLVLSILTFLPSPVSKIATFYLFILLAVLSYKLIRRLTI